MDSNIRGSHVSACDDSDDVTEAGDVTSVETTEACAVPRVDMTETSALPGVGYLMDSNIRGSHVSGCDDSDDVTEAGK